MDNSKIMKICLFTPGLNNRWGLPICYWGEPGIGKSKVVETTASQLGLPCYTLVASIREPSDFGGLPIPIEGSAGSRLVEYCAPSWAVDLDLDSDGKALIFVDEITTTAPATQAALLRMVLNGALGDYMLSPGIRFVAAANPVESAAGGWDLSAPLANRFGHFDWPVPTAPQWSDWLIDGGGNEPDGEPISAETEEERVMKVWPKAFARAKGLTSAFVRSRPELLHKMPDVGHTSRSKAWPSPRTFELATRAIAGAMIHGADDLTTDALVAGFLGGGVASELVAFRNEIDLPDPEAVLDGTVKFDHNRRRLDRTVAVLASCSALVASEQCERRDKRAEKLWEIVGAEKDGKLVIPGDLITPTARTLVRSRLHHGEAARKALILLQPLLQAAGVRP